MEEEIERKLKEVLNRLSNLETHIINLIIPIQTIVSVLSCPNDLSRLITLLSQPIAINDNSLRMVVNDISKYIEEFKTLTKDSTREMEFKFIGKKLQEISQYFDKIHENVITKRIELDFRCDGYELVKKPKYYDKTEPIEEPDQDLKNILGSLTERESQAIIHRVGLFGEKEKTFVEMENLLGVSRERCSLIYRKGLIKLRNASRKELVKKISNKKLKKAITGE